MAKDSSSIALLVSLFILQTTAESCSLSDLAILTVAWEKLNPSPTKDACELTG